VIETIRRALDAQQIKVYSVKETLKEGVELYFIKRRLDMRRCTRVCRYEVSVFRDFEEDGEKYRGRAEVIINDGMEREDIERKLADAYYSAAFSRLKWYPLPEGAAMKGEACQPDEDGLTGEEPRGNGTALADENDLANRNVAVDGDALADGAAAGREKARMDEALALAKAAYGVEEGFDGAFLNSFEIFCRDAAVRVVNSRGVDVHWTQHRLTGEFVAQCLEPQDVETYEDFCYERLDEAAVRAKVRRVLERTRDRSGACKAAPAGTYRLILSDKYVPMVMGYFKQRSHASMIYQKYSSYRQGDRVQEAGGGSVEGDLLNMTLTATAPYSTEGVPMKDRPLLTDGVLQTIHGGCRFCYYVGVEPTGDYEKLTVAPGRVSVEELKRTPYLHVVNFSDFQMDEMSGNFGGEIRLGYLYDGESVTCVTGGSVNGSIITAQKHLTLSEETQDGVAFTGPLAISVEGVTVAG